MIRKRRFSLAAFLTVAFFSAIVVRLADLQVIQYERLSARAERARSRNTVDWEPRGMILDRSGAVLAMSIQGGGCYADPKLVRDPHLTARALAPLLKVPMDELQAKMTQKRRFVWLARRMDPSTTVAVRSLKLSGIRVVDEPKRFYPEETLAAAVLGVVGNEHQGLSGVERAADGWLRGREVPELFREWPTVRTDPPAWAEREELAPQSVVLTLDRTLQMIAEQELARQLELSRAKSGIVVMQNPQTGEILAMASGPGFNPNWWGNPAAPAHYGPDTLKNPSVESVFEPGSTFKVVTAAGALQERKVIPGETIFCENGRWKIAGRFIKDHEKEGLLTFADVMGHSSNIGTAKVGLRLGAQGLYRYARAFGFGVPSGCGLPGDGAGILRQTQQWSGASLETISFGQEVGVTAIQMVNAYSAVANGGWLLEPRLFRGAMDEKGRYRQWANRQVIRQVLSSDTAATVRKILRHVVENGTGKSAQISGLTVAGKTGTAQKINPDTRQYDTERYLASFCGFAPAENPQLVIGVFLDEPRASIWGGSEAAPLFGRILRASAAYLKLTPAPVGPLAVSRTLTES